MIKSRIDGIRVAGLAASVPEQVRKNAEWGGRFGEDAVKKIIAATGVVQRHVSGERICASDLCFDAAERLIQELQWDRSEIGILVFVSQSPDYILPSTSFPLHSRLGLNKACAVFDINLGCSGYVYGLWVLSSLLLQSDAQKGLLLVGEINSRLNSPYDRGTALLAGDAGTATALEKSSVGRPSFYVLGTDGSGFRNLMISAGGMRTPHTAETLLRTERPDGSLRSDGEAHMNGSEVFTFTLREVPTMFKELREFSEGVEGEVDYYVLHQANRFILAHLAAKLKIPPEKLPLSLEQYGNTSSASVPLTIAACLRETVMEKSSRLILAGFGVGFSWAAVRIDIGPACVLDVGVVKEPT